MAIRPIRTALKVVKTMAWGYVGAAVSGVALGVYGAYAGMTNAELVTAALPVGMAGGLLAMTLSLKPVALVRARVRASSQRR